MLSAHHYSWKCYANYLTKERPKADNNYLFVRQLALFERLSDHASCYTIVERIVSLNVQVLARKIKYENVLLDKGNVDVLQSKAHKARR